MTTATRKRPKSSSSTSQYPPSFAGALFANSDPQALTSHSGKVRISPEDFGRLADYFATGLAPTDDDGNFVLYLNGRTKQSRSGVDYIFVTVQPSRKDFEAAQEEEAPF